MLIIPIKSGESIESALKKYKRKYRNTQIRQELQERQQYTKPSVRRRLKKKKAIHREKFLREQQEG